MRETRSSPSGADAWTLCIEGDRVVRSDFRELAQGARATPAAAFAELFPGIGLPAPDERLPARATLIARRGSGAVGLLDLDSDGSRVTARFRPLDAAQKGLLFGSALRWVHARASGGMRVLLAAADSTLRVTRLEGAEAAQSVPAALQVSGDLGAWLADQWPEALRQLAQQGEFAGQLRDGEGASAREWFVRVIARRDASGRIVAHQCIAEDRSLLEQARRDVRHKDAALHELLEELPMGCLVTDDAERIRSVNQAAIELLERTRQELVGGSLTRLRTELGFATDERAPPVGPPVYHARLERSGGAPRSFELREVQLAAFGEERLQLLLDVDDSARRTELGRREKELESLARLAHGVVHDLRNIVTVVNSVMQVIAAEHSPTEREELVEDLGYILDSGRKMIDRLTDLEGSADPRGEPVLGEISARTATLVRLMTKQAAIDIELVDALPADTRVAIDPLEFDRVLTNLLMNAREAVADRPTARIRVSLRVAGPAVVVLEVEDSGPGIAEADRSRVTEPFVSSKSGERGLGLALAKAFALRCGSRLHIGTSELGGALIRMGMPRGTPAPGAPAQ